LGGGERRIKVRDQSEQKVSKNLFKKIILATWKEEV
jgi:hypothetical protein